MKKFVILLTLTISCLTTIGCATKQTTSSMPLKSTQPTDLKGEVGEAK